mmetsp:Transcript_30282/g.36838  ORF Transcript_30282/g.36838 Transcript_30282/m.36838 type:complete len:127 (+) Transcript_30282:310-690(+)
MRIDRAKKSQALRTRDETKETTNPIPPDSCPLPIPAATRRTPPLVTPPVPEPPPTWNPRENENETGTDTPRTTCPTTPNTPDTRARGDHHPTTTDTTPIIPEEDTGPGTVPTWVVVSLPTCRRTTP